MDILIVEDYPCNATLLRGVLESQGHRVRVATDGVEAWRLLHEEHCPLVISDWVMPNLDGLELCRMIRRHEGWPYTYVILLTIQQGRDQRHEGLAAGADDFLTKPVDAAELAVRIEIARRILSVQEKLEQRNRQLAELASSDALTGLMNRRRFHEFVEDHCSIARRDDSPLSLVMLDVDHFKEYNDTHGHPAGDDALRAVASTLRDGVRKRDGVGRIGGEEFAILLPETDAGVAIDLGQRLCMAVAERKWPLRRLTASLGVATSRGKYSSPSRLFDQADRALYRSKHKGRNRVIHFGDHDEDEEMSGDGRDLKSAKEREKHGRRRRRDCH